MVWGRNVCDKLPVTTTRNEALFAVRVLSHTIAAPADILKKLSILVTKTAPEFSLSAVKSFREDVLRRRPAVLAFRRARPNGTTALPFAEAGI